MKTELPACPVKITMGLIGDKWKVLIIRDLLTGTKRFRELKKSLSGITQKVLTDNLRQMKASGLVVRKVYAEVPPKVEYSLSDTGLSLKPILDSMVEWGNENRESSREQIIILFIPSHTATHAVLASGGSIYISTCTFAYWSDRNIRPLFLSLSLFIANLSQSVFATN